MFLRLTIFDPSSLSASRLSALETSLLHSQNGGIIIFTKAQTQLTSLEGRASEDVQSHSKAILWEGLSIEQLSIM